MMVCLESGSAILPKHTKKKHDRKGLSDQTVVDDDRGGKRREWLVDLSL